MLAMYFMYRLGLFSSILLYVIRGPWRGTDLSVSTTHNIYLLVRHLAEKESFLPVAVHFFHSY